jgi:hypothetical protein
MDQLKSVTRRAQVMTYREGDHWAVWCASCPKSKDDEFPGRCCAGKSKPAADNIEARCEHNIFICTRGPDATVQCRLQDPETGPQVIALDIDTNPESVERLKQEVVYYQTELKDTLADAAKEVALRETEIAALKAEIESLRIDLSVVKEVLANTRRQRLVTAQMALEEADRIAAQQRDIIREQAEEIARLKEKTL